MKIVHVCLNGFVTDGWSYQDNLLPKYHKRMGHDVTIIASQWAYNCHGKIESFAMTNYFNSDGVFMIRLPNAVGNGSSKFKRFSGVLASLESEKPDVIFLHDFQCLDSLVICDYLKAHPRVVLYVDNHADFTNSATTFFSKNVLHKVIWRKIAKKLNKYAKKFYGVLPARVDFLSNVYKLPKSKCDLLLLGADDDLVNDKEIRSASLQLRKEHGIGESDILVVTGGKIDLWKTETLELMKAVNEISDRRVRLIVFGSIEEEIKKDFSSLLSERVEYAGWADLRKSYILFDSADLVCFPGRHSVYWEQVVAQKKPMVCKRIKGTDHVDIGGNVFFLDSTNSDAIKDALMHILFSDLYGKMLDKATSAASSRFLYSNIARCSIDQG